MGEYRDNRSRVEIGYRKLRVLIAMGHHAFAPANRMVQSPWKTPWFWLTNVGVSPNGMGEGPTIVRTYSSRGGTTACFRPGEFLIEKREFLARRDRSKP